MNDWDKTAYNSFCRRHGFVPRFFLFRMKSVICNFTSFDEELIRWAAQNDLKMSLGRFGAFCFVFLVSDVIYIISLLNFLLDVLLFDIADSSKARSTRDSLTEYACQTSKKRAENASSLWNKPHGGGPPSPRAVRPNIPRDQQSGPLKPNLNDSGPLPPGLSDPPLLGTSSPTH